MSASPCLQKTLPSAVHLLIGNAGIVLDVVERCGRLIIIGQGQQHGAQRLAVHDAGIRRHDGHQRAALNGKACDQRLIGGLGTAERHAHQLVAGQRLRLRCTGRVDEPPCRLGGGVAEDGLHLALLHDCAVVQNGHAVTDLLDHAHLVGDDNDRDTQFAVDLLDQLQDNLKIAAEDMIPICQDTGMAVIFMKIGQDVHFEGGSLEDAINEGVRQGYVEGYLRKSVVGDPIIRENTKDNTPAVIHYSIVPGDKVEIKVAPKGFGSENMSRVFMLKPADGIEGVKEAILTAVRDAGPNACPPMVVGVGIGGTFEKCALMAKEALTREAGSHSGTAWVKDLEEEMLETINKLGIGPGGLGGTTTALAVNVNTYPTHIAGLPVAVNICCHVNRHIIREV